MGKAKQKFHLAQWVLDILGQRQISPADLERKAKAAHLKFDHNSVYNLSSPQGATAKTFAKVCRAINLILGSQFKYEEFCLPAEADFLPAEYRGVAVLVLGPNKSSSSAQSKVMPPPTASPPEETISHEKAVSPEKTLSAGETAGDHPNAAKALRHCEGYKSLFQDISGFDDGDILPRTTCGISRHICDLESEKERQRGENPLAVPKLVPENEVADQFASRSRRRLWVLGSGGLGKTEFSKLFALRLAEQFCANPVDGVLPIRVDLKSLDPQTSCNGALGLLKNHLVPDEFDWIQEYLEAGRVAFILDGMDELRLDLHSFNGALWKLMLQYQTCGFIVTGRGDTIEPELARPVCFGKESVYVLKPLTIEQAKSYVNAYFGHNHWEKQAAGFVKRLETDRNLQEMVCNSPLLLAMACQVYGADSRIASHPVDLIERGLAVMWERRRSRRSVPVDGLPEDTICFKAISCLAAHSCVSAAGTFRFSLTLSRQEGLECLRANRSELETVGVVLHSDDDARRLILRLTPGSGVLEWTSRDTMIFGHRVLAEFLAARWVVEVGYPHWPHRHKAYTTLVDIRDRQITDFFGDCYWSRELQGVRYWLIYLLHRRNPSLLATLVRWQQLAVERHGATVPEEVRDADDLHRTVVLRLFNLVQILRNVDSHALADETFDRLVAEVGLQRVARRASFFKTLDGCSQRHLGELLRLCYLGTIRDSQHELPELIFASLLGKLDGCLDKKGNPISTALTFEICQDAAYRYLYAVLSGTDTWPQRTLSFWHMRFPWSDGLRRLLAGCLADAHSPFSAPRQWDCLFFLVANPPDHDSVELLLDGLRARLATECSVASSIVDTAALLHKASQPEADVVAEIARLYEKSIRDNQPSYLDRILHVFFAIRRPPTTLLSKLCDLPQQLAQRSGQNTNVLAAVIAKRIASAKNLDDPIVEPFLMHLHEKYPCAEALALRLTTWRKDSALFGIARDAAIGSLVSGFWESEDTTLNRLNALKSVNGAAYENVLDRVRSHIEDQCRTQQLSSLQAGRLLRAEKLRALIGLSDELSSFAETRIAELVLDFGQALARNDLWERCHRAAPGWPRDRHFLAAASSFSKPHDPKEEAAFLAALLGCFRKHASGDQELADRVIERLSEIGTQFGVEWVKSEPVSNAVKRFMLAAIQVRRETSLADAHDVIKVAAASLSEDADVRHACIALMRERAKSEANGILRDLVGRTLLEGWPGDAEVLQGIMEAGLNKLMYSTNSWDRWLIRWKGEGESAWIPKTPNDFQGPPIQVGTSRGALLLGIRDSACQGLPGDLAIEARVGTALSIPDVQSHPMTESKSP